MTNKKKNTVKNIIYELNQNKISYGILRNYKNFPNIKSDLDLISNINISKIKRILKKISKNYKWDYLFYDNSKSKFFSENNKIETFYFVDFNTLLFLQIDFFRSLSLISTPYFKIEKKESLEYFKKDVPIIPIKVTNTYHSFQIVKILNSKNNEKIKRYKKAFLQNNLVFEKKVFFEKNIIKLLKKYLKKDNIFCFKILISFYKFLIFTKYYLLNFSKIYLIFYRIFELFLLYFFCPSGFNLKIFYNNIRKKKSNEKYFNKLKKSQIINDWKYENEVPFFYRKIFLERRNILIKNEKNVDKKKTIQNIFKEKFIKNYIKI